MNTNLAILATFALTVGAFAPIALLSQCDEEVIRLRNTGPSAAEPIVENRPQTRAARIYAKSDLPLPGSLEEVDKARKAMQAFLDAIAQVESAGCNNIVGDNGKAIGRMQIWEMYWGDALYYCPELGGEYSDCKTKLYAERVTVAYLLRFNRKAVEAKDWQTLARIHNGGPKGHTKEATKKYWVKVRKELSKKP